MDSGLYVFKGGTWFCLSWNDQRGVLEENPAPPDWRPPKVGLASKVRKEKVTEVEEPVPERENFTDPDYEDTPDDEKVVDEAVKVDELQESQSMLTKWAAGLNQTSNLGMVAHVLDKLGIQPKDCSEIQLLDGVAERAKELKVTTGINPKMAVVLKKYAMESFDKFKKGGV
jgi:hypothetical protein